MAKTLPEAGMSRNDIVEHLTQLKRGDIRWEEGRTPLFVFKAEEELSQINREAFNLYFSENALGSRRAFLSIQEMEKDIVSIGRSLLNGPDDGAGFFTTGGSESIICAVKAARNWSRLQRDEPGFRGNLVLAETGHPAFTKACDMMDLELRRVPVRGDYLADPVAMEAAADKDTIMMVGSAPCFPYGVIDPIEELGEVAERNGLWLHVDACVGGYLTPFVEKLGYDISPWDFRVPGVSSISADLHKFGYAPKPASTVFYREQAKADQQMYIYDDWPNGTYATATIVGTRPGGGVAGAWATLHALGQEGYLRVTRRLLAMIEAYKDGVETIPGLKVIGKPQLSIFAFTSDEVDLLQVGERMRDYGWLPGFVRKPKGMHAMLSLIHEPAREEWLANLQTSVEQERGMNTDETRSDVKVVY